MEEVLNFLIPTHRSSRPEVFCKKGVLKNFANVTGKYLCWSNKVSFLKEIPTQVFSSEFREIIKNTYFYRTPLVDASSPFTK